jgi:hypothetical protein
MGTTAYGDPGSFRATKHVSVFLSYGKEVHEVLIYANIPLMELQECLAAGFLHQLDATSSNIPVAVKDPRKDIYYPISLLRTSPELFKNTSYEILFSSSGGGNEEEALNAAKDRKKHHKKRSHHKKKQSSKLSSIRKDFDSPAHDDEDKQDDEEFLRELDLTDFELPLLVNEFTQASPTGVLDRTSFERSLEKILSQVEYRYCTFESDK